MALNIFSRLMPPEISFTGQFCEQAKCIHEAAQELRDMVEGQKIGADQHVASIRRIETRADGVARQIFIGANRTGSPEAATCSAVVLPSSPSSVRRRAR